MHTKKERKDSMNKRKTVFTTVVIGAGIMAIIDRIRLHNKVEELEEKTTTKRYKKDEMSQLRDLRK